MEETRALDSKIVGVQVLTGSLDDVTTIVDIGTGTGCIAITLALEHPGLHIIATDISEDALVIAKKNAKDLNAAIDFRCETLLDPLKDLSEPFLIVSNPPYIPSKRSVMKDVADYEPHSALFAGSDGLDVLRPLVQQALAHPLCRGIIVECEEEQAKNLAEL